MISDIVLLGSILIFLTAFVHSQRSRPGDVLAVTRHLQDALRGPNKTGLRSGIWLVEMPTLTAERLLQHSTTDAETVVRALSHHSSRFQLHIPGPPMLSVEEARRWVHVITDRMERAPSAESLASPPRYSIVAVSYAGGPSLDGGDISEIAARANDCAALGVAVCEPRLASAMLRPRMSAAWIMGGAALLGVITALSLRSDWLEALIAPSKAHEAPAANPTTSQAPPAGPQAPAQHPTASQTAASTVMPSQKEPPKRPVAPKGHGQTGKKGAGQTIKQSAQPPGPASSMSLAPNPHLPPAGSDPPIVPKAP